MVEESRIWVSVHFSGHCISIRKKARGHSSNLAAFLVLSGALPGPGLGALCTKTVGVVGRKPEVRSMAEQDVGDPHFSQTTLGRLWPASVEKSEGPRLPRSCRELVQFRMQKLGTHIIKRYKTSDSLHAVSYTHLTLPTKQVQCRSRWSPYH